MATICFLINVPFSGSGFNRVFLPVFYLFICVKLTAFFPQSNRFSNEISLNGCFSLCITFLMICYFFSPQTRVQQILNFPVKHPRRTKRDLDPDSRALPLEVESRKQSLFPGLL